MLMNSSARPAAKAATEAVPVGPSHDAVLEALDRFASDAPQRPSTKHLYRGIATRFVRWLDSQGLEPAQVTPEVIERFFDGHELSSPSKTTYRAGLRFLFSALVHGDILADNSAAAARLGLNSEKNDELTERPAGFVPTREELRAGVHKLALDPIEEGSEDFDAALVLLAGGYLGTAKILPLSRVTGVHPRKVVEFAGRLRASGVWTASGKTNVEWFDGEAGQLAFWLDVWIATGVLERHHQHRSGT